MTVPSFAFLGFALVVILLVRVSQAPHSRQAILLLANLVFIASFVNTPGQLLPYAGFMLLGALGVAGRRALGAWSVWVFPPLVLIAFVWLKQYLFVPRELLLPHGYLLVGLSYVFFRVMHLVIDGWELVPRGPGGWVSYINYTLNFTSLVSGPIQRYEDYRRDEQTRRRFTVSDVWLAAERVITGFFKVYIVSTLLDSVQRAQLADLAAASETMRLAHAAALVGLYPIYLYFNFSGYTDFVIGIARFLDIDLPENFDRPFASGNFITFWSRWHMSLSNWLKTYVYTPSVLAMMRRTPAALEPLTGVAAYFLTFFLVGLWHGQTSEFVFFGFLQGGGVAANKLYQLGMARLLGRVRYARLTKNQVYALLMRGLTFTWFAFTLLWFWSSWSQLEEITRGMRVTAIVVVLGMLMAGATVGLEALDWMRNWIRRFKLWGDVVTDSAYLRLALAFDMIVILALTAIAMHAPPSQVVYQAF